MNRILAQSSLALGLLVAVAGAQAGDRLYNGQSVHGRSVEQPQHARVVDVDAHKTLNVNCGDTVTFRKGSQSFSWKFDTVGHGAVDLRAIAPAGFSDKKLMIYVSRSEGERT